MKSVRKFSALSLFLAGVFLLSSCGFRSYRDDNGLVKNESEISVHEMRAGDCYDFPAVVEQEGSDPSSIPQYEKVVVKPCSASHDSEIYYVGDVANSATYPGIDVLTESTLSQCRVQFNLFVGLDYDSSALEIDTIFPSEQNWNKDRPQYSCGVFDPEGPATGTTFQANR